jgi:hypothetical protein
MVAFCHDGRDGAGESCLKFFAARLERARWMSNLLASEDWERDALGQPTWATDFVGDVTSAIVGRARL